MSGYSHCNAGMTAEAINEYISGLMRLKNDEGQVLGKLMEDAYRIHTAIEEQVRAGKVTADAILAELRKKDEFKTLTRERVDNYLRQRETREQRVGKTASDVYPKNRKMKEKHAPDQPQEGNHLNDYKEGLQHFIPDGEIANVEAVIPADVAEEFWKGKLGPNPYGGNDRYTGAYDRKYWDTYIVTVVHKDKMGNTEMEEYTDHKTGKTKTRPKTSVRVVSYNPHQGDSQDVSEQSVIQKDIVKDTLVNFGRQLMAESKQKAPQAVGKASAASLKKTYEKTLDVKTSVVDTVTGVVTRSSARPLSGRKGKSLGKVGVRGNLDMDVSKSKAQKFFTPEQLAALQKRKSQEA